MLKQWYLKKGNSKITLALIWALSLISSCTYSVILSSVFMIQYLLILHRLHNACNSFKIALQYFPMHENLAVELINDHYAILLIEQILAWVVGRWNVCSGSPCEWLWLVVPGPSSNHTLLYVNESRLWGVPAEDRLSCVQKHEKHMQTTEPVSLAKSYRCTDTSVQTIKCRFHYACMHLPVNSLGV